MEVSKSNQVQVVKYIVAAIHKAAGKEKKYNLKRPITILFMNENKCCQQIE